MADTRVVFFSSCECAALVVDRDSHRSKCGGQNRSTAISFGRIASSCDHRNFHSRVRSVTRREYRAQGIAGDERHKVHCNHRRTPVNGGTRVYVWQKKGGCVIVCV